MSTPFVLKGPEGVGAENGDFAIVSRRGTLIALIYRGYGPQGKLVARRRGEATLAALIAQHDSCSWCEGIRADGEICACVEQAA